VWQFQIIKTLSKPFRAALCFWRISSFAKKSRISITSEFPSVSEHLHVRETMVGHLRHIEEDLGKRVAAGLAFDKIPVAPPAAAPVQEMKLSPALQIIGKMKNTLMGRAMLADGSMLAADGQLAGTPSVLFDAVAAILSYAGAKALSREGAAIDFARDAFGHLKAIAVDKGGRALLKTANVGQDAGVVDANDKVAFIAAAKTRQWDREKSIRTLA
jgi:catalase